MRWLANDRRKRAIVIEKNGEPSAARRGDILKVSQRGWDRLCHISLGNVELACASE